MTELERLIYGYHFMHDIIIPAAIKADIFPADIHKMSVCLENFAVYKCASCGKLHFASSYRCKNRFCVVCQHQRTKIWLARLLPLVRNWKLSGNYVCMLNFTMVDMVNLEFMINAINNAFRIFSHDNKNNRDWFQDRFPGGVRSLEVVIGENSKLWHVHLHCIVLQDSYERDYNELEFRWNRSCQVALGVYDRKVGSVYISAINHNFEKSILEVIKYILKPNLDLYIDPVIFSEAYYCLRGRRQVNTWGIFRDLVKIVDNDFNKVSGDFVCDDCGCDYAYVNFLNLKECKLNDNRSREENSF